MRGSSRQRLAGSSWRRLGVVTPVVDRQASRPYRYASRLQRHRRERLATAAVVTVMVVGLLALGAWLAVLALDRIGSEPRAAVVRVVERCRPGTRSPGLVKPKPARPTAPTLPATAEQR